MSHDADLGDEAPVPDKPSHEDQQMATTPADESDEWEYEYDHAQTEDFYITLDLTSQVPLPQRKRKRSSATEVNPSPFGQFDASAISLPTQPDDELKIRDLHTDNPLVFYQGHIFSCHWATTLGTDLLFTKPPSSPPPQPSQETPNQTPTQTPSPTPAGPTSSTPSIPSTAAEPQPQPHAEPSKPSQQHPPSNPPIPTTIRLVAAPATLTQKPHSHKPQPRTQDATATTTPARRAKQTVFLHRLSQAKHTKGDTDTVPMWTTKPNHQPALDGLDGADAETRHNILRRRRRWRGRIEGALAAAVGSADAAGDTGLGDGAEGGLEQQQRGDGL